MCAQALAAGGLLGIPLLQHIKETTTLYYTHTITLLKAVQPLSKSKPDVVTEYEVCI